MALSSLQRYLFISCFALAAANLAANSAAAQVVALNSFFPFYLSHSNVDYGTVELGSRKVVSIVLRPRVAGSIVTKIELDHPTKGLRLLSSSETATRGGLSCLSAGALEGRYCVIQLELQALKIIPVTAKLSVQSLQPNNLAAKIEIPIVSKVKSSDTADTAFEIVSLRKAALAAGFSNIHQYLKWNLMRVAPTTWTYEDIGVFSYFSALATSAYKISWFNSVFNNEGHAWDAFQDGTAITPRHIILAAHFPRSGPIVFHGMNGQPFTTNIVGVVSVPGTDIAVARIEPALPKGWTIYALPDPSEGFGNQFSEELLGAPLITHRASFANPTQRYMVRKISISSFWEIREADALAEYSYYFSVNPQNGDSGNPSFLWVGDRMVLISHCSAGPFGCSGPNYASRSVQDGIRLAISQL